MLTRSRIASEFITCTAKSKLSMFRAITGNAFGSRIAAVVCENETASGSRASCTRATLCWWSITQMAVNTTASTTATMTATTRRVRRCCIWAVLP